MPIKKYTDYRTWWDGLRTNLIKCVGTTGISFLGSNGIANMGVESLKGLGISWQQAGGFFMVHIGWEIFSYMRDNQPKVITETVDTTFKSIAPDGSKISQSSSTTTTTPVEPPKT